ncbi:Rpn family recombination-promoting nuclease/putative transposase [Sporosarcina sp. FSL W7-1349]|uniref:Rpn family recombination-promoting nuclease/putative transposase n=1 Tax=Sporosarcina sp. FSL W7-1349 TaxID=2921561 RepID=UPI0030FC966B
MVKEQPGQYGVKLLELRNDFVFKSFFTDVRNNNLLLHFVNSIVGGTIISLKVIDPTNKMGHSSDKLSILDLRAITGTGEQINIEVQLERHKAFNERVLYYWSKTYASQIKSSEPYVNLKKVIQIIIVDFEMLPSGGIHSTFQLIEPTSGIVFSNHLVIHVLQLGKQQEKSSKEMDNLEKWMLFFKGDYETKEEIAMESSAFKEAFEEIKRLSMDPETVQLAINREIALRDHIQRLADAEEEGFEKGIKKGIKKGREQGLEEGREKGQEAKAIEIVQRLYEKSTPLSFIAEVTGMSVEEVKAIIDSTTKEP